MMNKKQAAFYSSFSVPNSAFSFLFLLLVFSLAFVTPSIYVKNQRLAATDFLFPIVFALWLICVFLGRCKFRRHRFYWLLIFYFAAMFLSTVFSPDFSRSIVKLLGETYLLGLAVLTFNLVRDEKDFRRVIVAWLAGAFVAAAIGVVTILIFYVQPQSWLLDYTTYAYGAVPVGNYPRLKSTFVTASMFCNYLTVSLAMLFIAERAKIIGKALFSILYFLILICAVFTISSGIGGVALFIGVWYWTIYRDKQRLFARASLAFGITSAIFFCAMNCVALQPYANAPYSISLPFSETVLYPSSRFLVWTEGLKTFAANFFVGNGLGRSSCEVLFQNTDGSYSLLTDAHNIFINVAAQTGIFGLLAIAAIALYFLRQMRRPKITDDFSSTAFSGLTLAFLSAFIFQGLTGSFEDMRHLWVLIGLLLSGTNGKRKMDNGKC
jgi:hypothetical protein